MKKDHSITSVLRVLIIASALFPVTVHSQDRSAAEKNSLCQKEKQNLDNLNEKLTTTSFKIPLLKGYAAEMTAYQQQALKYNDKRLDDAINLCLAVQKSYKESLERTVAGSIEELRHKYSLENLQIKLDYLTEIKAERLIGEKVDPKDNHIQKAIQQYKKDIDQLEDAEKYLRNDITMNKERISRLRCDDKTTTNITKKENDTKPGKDPTEDQGLDRCQNNKERIAELEKQARVVNADLSFAWTKKEIQEAKNKMAFVKTWSEQRQLLATERSQLDEICKEYEFNYDDCTWKMSQQNCLGSLERTIGEKIDRAKSLDRAALLAKQKDLEAQISKHRNNLIALGCDGKTAGGGGSLKLVGPEILGKNRKESFNPAWYTEYSYSATTASMIVQNDPPDRRVVKWEFSGIPTGGISPGDIITITVSGSVKLGTPGEISPYPSAGVRATGLDLVSGQNAYVGVNKQVDGKYVFKVPANAKSCTIEIGADYGVGTFARYKYEKK